MGKLIKNHWARLLILVASTYQILASIYAFFWPKLFFDFLTTTLDPCVRPIPILQIINLLLGLLGLAWEWPLPLFTTASLRARKSYPNRARAEARLQNGGTGDTTKSGLQVSVQAAGTGGAGSSISSREGEKGDPGALASISGRGRGTERGVEVDVSRVSRFLAAMHRSIEARLMLYPLSCLASFLLYQATNAALYYLVGMGVYFWAFSEGEVVMGVPWTLPRKGRMKPGSGNV